MSDVIPPHPGYPDTYQGPTSDEEAIQHIDIVAEQAVLGAILLNNEAFWDVDGWLQTKHFYEPLHQNIYEALSSIVHEGGVADPISLRARFSQNEDMTEIGGTNYLAGLVTSAVSMRPASYGRIVVEMATRRALAFASSQILDSANNAELTVDEMMAQAESDMAEVSDDNLGKANIKTLDEAIQSAIDAATEARKSEEGIVGMPSGLAKLDEVLGGFRKGQLIIVAARPGMGKSGLAVKFAVEGARRSDVGVLLISLEMKDTELGERAISMDLATTGLTLPYNKISKGQFTGAEAEAIKDIHAASRSIPVRIEDYGSQTVSQINSICRNVDRDFKKEGRRLGCVIIDYLQIITPHHDDLKQGDTARIGHISNGLKSLAMRMNIPVIALSQLNRQVESRDDKRPTLADLRNSGDIEQDAHVVIFLLRKEYYLRKQKPKGGVDKLADWAAEMVLAKNRLDIFVDKNRGGPTADIEVYCDIAVNRFEDEAPESGQESFSTDWDAL